MEQHFLRALWVNILRVAVDALGPDQCEVEH
jgi:hypothetical protein